MRKLPKNQKGSKVQVKVDYFRNKSGAESNRLQSLQSRFRHTTTHTCHLAIGRNPFSVGVGVVQINHLSHVDGENLLPTRSVLGANLVLDQLLLQLIAARLIVPSHVAQQVAFVTLRNSHLKRTKAKAGMSAISRLQQRERERERERERDREDTL